MKSNIAFLLLLFILACKANAPLTSNETETDAIATKEEHRVSAEIEVEEVEEEEDEPLYSDNLDNMIGQMIMVGINDRKSLPSSDNLRSEISEGKMGGIILFEKNVAPARSKETLIKLVADMQELAPTPLFISIDEEGGRVHRLKEKYGFIAMPGADYLGNIDNKDTTLHYTRKLAALLDELGINLNFAPNVDVALNKDNPVIYKVGRSYSSAPDVVAKHALASIQAHHEYGVKTAIKHFPGHGSSDTDSHLGLTDVTDLWKIIELMPFNKIIASGKADAIMTAHIVNCRLDVDCLPATLSKTVITDVLRNLLDYNGVVISDDMQMYAISHNYGLENAIKMSINAGVDILLFGNNVNLNDRITATEIHTIIRKLVDNGEIKEKRIKKAYQRIMTLKHKQLNDQD